MDCSFGVMGILPLLYCQRWTLRLERARIPEPG